MSLEQQLKQPKLKKEMSDNDKRIRAIYGIKECPLNLCDGAGNRFRWDDDNDRMVPYWSLCECKKETERSHRLKISNLPNKGFEEFDTINKNKTVVDAYKLARTYADGFNKLRYLPNNSMALLSKIVDGKKIGIGGGKTHLAVAAARNIIMNSDVTVVYMPYREAISRLKTNMLELSHKNEMAKYKTANLLVIDDLFKGKLTDTDISLMYEIINYRYEKNLPMIITSEMDMNALNKLDEGVGSRIQQMCKLSTIELGSDNHNQSINYRRG